MKKSTAILLTLVFSLSLAGCTPKNQDPAASEPVSDIPVSDATVSEAPALSDAPCSDEEASVTFTDDLGRSVTVPAAPARTAALLGSYADLWVTAGGTVTAAPDDAWDDYDFFLPEDAVNLGRTKDLSLEQLFASEPDFVIASTRSKQHLEWQEPLESAGIPTAYFEVNDFDDYLRVLRICTDITGIPEIYEEKGTSLSDAIDEIIGRNKEKEAGTCLTLRTSAASIRAKNNDGTVLGAMLSDFGCRNIADSDESLLENLSIESIILEDPDRIFLIEVGDDPDAIRANVEKLFSENPLWKELSAVKNGKVYYMDKHLYNMKPNARWAEAYEKLEEILYPSAQ